MPLPISVSNVAALIGHHQYTTAQEALLAYLKKRHAHTYYTSLHRLGHTLDKEDAVVQLKRHLKATMPAYTHTGSQSFSTPSAGRPPITYLFRYKN